MYLCLAEQSRPWELLDRKEKDMKDDLDDIPMPYLLYVVLGLLAAIAGAAIVILRILQHH
jgi:hypothetical protein